jgi:ubiquinone biosynthesis protein UbiJ
MLTQLIDGLQPPAWVVDEVQNRIVLWLNHVLMQEPQAQDRVRRQQGKSACMRWGRFDMTLVATPAGLLERPPLLGSPAEQPVRADLTVTLTQAALSDLLQVLVRGEKPTVNIDGDVQLAAEVAWLADNLRWDAEEDLSRLVGDVPARTFMRAFGMAVGAVRMLAARAAPVMARAAAGVSGA